MRRFKYSAESNEAVAPRRVLITLADVESMHREAEKLGSVKDFNRRMEQLTAANSSLVRVALQANPYPGLFEICAAVPATEFSFWEAALYYVPDFYATHVIQYIVDERKNARVLSKRLSGKRVDDNCLYGLLRVKSEKILADVLGLVMPLHMKTEVANLLNAKDSETLLSMMEECVGISESSATILFDMLVTKNRSNRERELRTFYKHCKHRMTPAQKLLTAALAHTKEWERLGDISLTNVKIR